MQSSKSNLDIPSEVVWNSAILADDEVIVYISPSGEKEIFSKSPIEDTKKYKVLLFDYSL